MQRKLRKEADDLEPVIAALLAEEQHFARLEDEAESVLPSISAERSMFGSKMELQNDRVNKRVKISKAMTSDSPAKKALLEANLTPKDIAALLGVGHSTVNAWCTGARSIPRQYVGRLKEKHRIPAKVWPKIGA